MTDHVFSIADDNGISECMYCGLFRLRPSARHPSLYSRQRSLRDGTWGAVRPDCAPPVRPPEES